MTSVQQDKERALWETLWIRTRWLARREGFLLSVLTAVVIGVWAFIEIADEVTSGDSRSFDEWAVQSLRQAENLSEPIGPHWLKVAALDATALGGALVLTMMILFVGLFLLLEHKRGATLMVWAAAGGGQVLSFALKQLFQRPRPQVVPHLSEVSSASFPSGHSMMSAVVYLTLGALVAQFVVQRRVKVYVLSVAVFLTVMVGLTRIYLGVHYPTDVLAGWTAGLIWALLCWSVATRLQRRGKVEPAGMTPSAAGD